MYAHVGIKTLKLLFGRVWERNVQKCVPHLQQIIFLLLTNNIFVVVVAVAVVVSRRGSFSINDGNVNENVVVKCEFALFLSLRDYSKHFNVTKVWQTIGKNETSMNGVQFRGENENLSSSADVLPKTSNLVISRCCFSDEGQEMYKNEKMHVQSVQSYCFCL